MKFILFLLFFISWIFALEIPASIDAQFTQTVTNEHNRSIHYKGKLYFKAPDQTKWVYTYPSSKIICINNNNITVIEHDLEQVTIYQNKNHIDFLQLYDDAVKLEKNRYVTYFQDNRYYFQTKDKKIEKLYFSDALHNSSVIDFSNVLYNQELPSLSCVTPKNYDVILE